MFLWDFNIRSYNYYNCVYVLLCSEWQQSSGSRTQSELRGDQGACVETGQCLRGEGQEAKEILAHRQS